MNCPICGAEIDENKHRVAEMLDNHGYFHLDIWLKCPQCKYTPAFGKELSDPKPVYWRPESIPADYKRQVEDAFHKHIPEQYCPFDLQRMELHKIWLHSWKRGEDLVLGQTVVSEGSQEVRDAFGFIVSRIEGNKVGTYFVPAGIMAQYKCTNWRCKYVRYVTL